MFRFYYTASILKPFLLLIYSSIMKALKIHHPFIKVGLLESVLFSVSFIIVMRTENIVSISK